MSDVGQNARNERNAQHTQHEQHAQNEQQAQNEQHGQNARNGQRSIIGPRTGPIVWGALILVFCGYVLQRTFGDGRVDSATWATAAVIGVGALLLVVGAAVILRDRRR